MSELQSALLLRKQLAELNKNPVEGFSAGLIDDDDIYRWEVLIIGPPETLYEGGFFKAHLLFPKEYPLRPPRMKFVTEIWHPNIERNGDVCISILHEPGDDKWGYEQASERWLPVHTVETILISVISMLADPNDESPANVDAATVSIKENSLFYPEEFSSMSGETLAKNLATRSKPEDTTKVFFINSGRGNLKEYLTFILFSFKKEWRENYVDFKRKVARCVRKSQEECI